MAGHSRILGELARQAGHPGGLVGRLVGVGLNLADRKDVAAALDALTIPPGAVVADIGFGGGVALRFLLDRVDARGKVHGVEVSSAMLSRAGRRFRDEIARGRLELHRASITHLPFGAATLDSIVTTHTVYFVSELQPAFSEMGRPLKRSGRAVIGLGDPDAMEGFRDFGFHVRPISGVVHAMESAGLTLVEHRQSGKGAARFHVLLAARADAA